MASLLIKTPLGKQFRYDLQRDCVRLGRSQKNDLVLDDLSVSRVHAEIVRCPRGYDVHDLNGKNGTTVNDRRITGPTLLRPEDTIRVGRTVLVFEGRRSGRLELVPSPLPLGPGTTILPAEEVRQTGITLNISSRDGEELTPVEEATGARIHAVESPLNVGSDYSSSPPIPNIVVEADRELVIHQPIERILDKIMDLAHQATGFERGVLELLENRESLAPVIVVPPHQAADRIVISRGVVDHVVRKGEAVLIRDAQEDDRFSRRESIVGEKIRSAMCVPLWSDDRVLGYIYVDSRRETGLFSEKTLRVLTHLASVAAVKIENARLFREAVKVEALEGELAAAAEIWARHLPSATPTIPNYLLYGSSVPCRSVGGDCYDFIELPDGRYGIGLGDVAGKGLPASLLMCSFSTSLRALSSCNLSQVEMVEILNRVMFRHCPPNRYVTFFYGVLDPIRNSLSYVNAGHVPPFLIRPGAEVIRLGQMGLPVGLFDGVSYKAGKIEFEPGDHLLCCSDGVTEAQDPSESFFGEARPASIVSEHAGAPPEEIAGALTDAIEAHCAGADHQDDLTLLLLTRVC